MNEYEIRDDLVINELTSIERSVIYATDVEGMTRDGMLRCIRKEVDYLNIQKVGDKVIVHKGGNFHVYKIEKIMPLTIIIGGCKFHRASRSMFGKTIAEKKFAGYKYSAFSEKLLKTCKDKKTISKARHIIRSLYYKMRIMSLDDAKKINDTLPELIKNSRNQEDKYRRIMIGLSEVDSNMKLDADELSVIGRLVEETDDIVVEIILLRCDKTLCEIGCIMSSTRERVRQKLQRVKKRWIEENADFNNIMERWKDEPINQPIN